MPVVEGVARSRGRWSAARGVGHGVLVLLPAEPGAADAIAWLGRDGQARPLRPTPAMYFVIRVAPDGQRLAMDIRDGEELTSGSRAGAGRDGPAHDQPRPGRHAGLEAGRTMDRLLIDVGRSAYAEPLPPAGGRTGEALRLTESATPQVPTSWHPSGCSLAFNDTSGRTHSRSSSRRVTGPPGGSPRRRAPFEDSPSTRRTGPLCPTAVGWADVVFRNGDLRSTSPFPASGESREVDEWGPVRRGGANAERALLSIAAHDHGAPYRVEVTRSTWTSPPAGQRPPSKPGPFRNVDLHPDGDRFAVTTPAGEERKRDHLTIILGFADELRRLVPVR